MSLLHRLLPVLMLLGLVQWVAQRNHSLLFRWSEQLSYLPLVSIIFTMLVATKFGRSRVVIACLLLAYLCIEGLWPANQYIAFVSLFLTAPALTVLLGLLLWDRDRGFALPNLLLTLLWMTAAVLVTYALFEHFPEQWLHWLKPINTLLPQSISPLLSPVHWSLYLVLLLFGLLRLILNTSHSHCMLFTSMLMMPVLAHQDQFFITQVTVFTLSLVFLTAVIIDSHNMAFKDELTTIPSRRALMQYVQTLGTRYVVAMADIDHFKSFNDSYGHDVGDQVLKLVASKLQKVSGGGKAFRYGGEEFTLLFPRKSVHQVLPHLEQLREDIAAYTMVIRAHDRPVKKSAKKTNPHRRASVQKKVNVSCSFGVASRSRLHSQFSAVLKLADQALYDAKKAGRNCVKSR
ncbi:GGDEF domain-containing protein [Lacimicrobium sp. SS2-24]|uniref:GGDEF domain-containing protein n=1 Tax=Lacimicrobium sp. SS2-24 TaxID=2005569 RepID=UPI001FF00BAD|nr:GGDEF domain-containing protein [Lacimicrobium sp. SS2-24]